MHLQTDNVAWLCAALVIGSVFRPCSAWSLVTSGCFMFLAVSVRQNFIWLAGPIILAGLLSTPPLRGMPSSNQGGEVSGRTGWGLFGLSLLAVVPGLLLLVGFRSLWGGLVPPNFQYFHSFHVVWIALGFALAVVGFYAPFFLLALPRGLALLRRNTGGVLLAGVVGACCALVPPSDFSIEFGRSGGIMWKLVAAGPVVADRSLVLGFFAAIGAGSIALIWLSLREAGEQRGASYPLAATTSTMFSIQSYQRYYDFRACCSWHGGCAVSRSHAHHRAARLRTTRLRSSPALRDLEQLIELPSTSRTGYLHECTAIPDHPVPRSDAFFASSNRWTIPPWGRPVLVGAVVRGVVGRKLRGTTVGC